MVGRLNRKLRGWVNYFDLGSVGRAYSVVNYHVTSRLRRWLCRKHKVRGQGYSRYPDRHLYLKLGLYQLSRSGRRFPNATV
jgi:RNA-directed DNA polymerase